MAAGDFGKGVESEAKVFGKKVATESVVEAVEYSLKMFVGANQSIVVTGIGDDDIVLRQGGDVGSFVQCVVLLR